jgi:hypothetical protein
MKKVLISLALAIPLALTAAPIFTVVTASLATAGHAVAAAAPTAAPTAEIPKRILIRRGQLPGAEGELLELPGTCAPGGVCPPRLRPGNRRLDREIRLVEPGAPFMPVLGMLIPITMFICVALVIIVAVSLAHQSRVSRYRLIEIALTEGKEIPPQLLADTPGRGDPIGGALVLIATGVGLGVALGLVANPVQAAWGLIPLLIGLALLIAIPLRRKIKPNGD